MRLTITLAALALLAPVAAPAAVRPTAEQKLQKLLDGYTAGKPVSCMPQGPDNQSTTLDGVIVYTYGTTRYVNRFGGGCPFLREQDALVIRLYGGQLCRGDIAQVVDTGARFPRGSCVFGDFTPYRRPKVK